LVSNVLKKTSPGQKIFLIMVKIFETASHSSLELGGKTEKKEKKKTPADFAKRERPKYQK